MKDPMKPRDKITQKMSRDGLTEQNQTTGESELISKRIQDADFQKTPEQQAAQDAAQLQGAVSPSSPLPHAPEHFSKPQHPVTGPLHKFLVMGDHQHDPPPPGQVPDHPGHFHHTGIVKAAGGFIKDQDRLLR